MQYIYHAENWDADVDYLGRFKTVLSSRVSSINFADPANIRKVHRELMGQVRTEAIHISYKNKLQIEPKQFEWDKFLPAL